MSVNTDLVQEFEKLLGNKPYFTKSRLIDLGLFGSSNAASDALKTGLLPSIKMSSKRTVIPRSAVVEYFRKNLENVKQINDKSGE
jgi:hypothetical protein